MRRIKSAKISFISLVPRGANQLPVLYKSEDQTAQFECLTKDDRLEEHGELTAVVYVPETFDSQKDIASAAVIKQMAHDFVRNGGSVDIKHNLEAMPREKVSVVESFLVQKNDTRFADLKDYSGRPVDATGGWGVVIKVDDAELRRLYREGHWNGVSMFGPAIVEPLTKSADTNIPDELAKRLAGGSNNRNPNETDMDIKELTQALTANNESLVKSLTDSIVTGLAKALKPEAPADDKTNLIKFEGDPTNVADVRKHAKRVRASQVNWNDAQSVAKYEAELAKEATDAAAAEAAAKAATDKNKSPELVKAEAELAKAQAELVKVQKGSNQSPDDKGDQSQAFDTGLSKSDLEGMKAGDRMAAYINRQRGFATK